MGKVIVINHVSLDGVMQAPGRPDEDRRDGFTRGGWAAERSDEATMAAINRVSANGGPILLGRWTYESFHAHWPKQTDSPFSGALDAARKYVASTTLKEPLAWQNSTLLQGDVADAVRALKAKEVKDFLVFGSGTLVQSLTAHGLVDTYLLLIHPIVLGRGRRLFPDNGAVADLRLVDATTTPSGILAVTYESTKEPR